MIAFVFPGQGSQQPQMGVAWQNHPSFELVEEASSILDRDLARLLTEADADELQITRNTQVATFLLSMVALDAIERLGIAPQVCAGHSLGEYAALVAAGAMSFEAGLKLVQERGEAMAQAAESSPGAMIALLGLQPSSVEDIIKDFGNDLWVANYNSESQIVMSGTLEAVSRLETTYKDYGVRRATKLKVGGAFHSPYMTEAKERLAKAIKNTKFYDLEVPVIANVDAKEHIDRDEWPSLLADQLTHPVQWEMTMRSLAELKPLLVVEVGPGEVLTNLIKRSHPELNTVSVQRPDDLEKLVEVVADEGPLYSWATSHQGEHFFGDERLVVATTSGVFAPSSEITIGQPITVGTLIGSIGGTPVHSPFAGILEGMFAVQGERVTVGQPLAWLRALENG
jgi:[acyl-carrier-protein] S-malonyltransferase